jgi:S1-C subfamily serine protease
MFLSPVATELVADHEDLFEEAKFPYIASEEFRLVASKELRAYGYTVLGKESPLFDKDDWDLARYQLGGTVTSLDLHLEEGKQESYEAKITITWQLFDSLEEALLYEEATTGVGEQAGIASAAVFSAFKSALHNLMASRAFVAKVEKSGKQVEQAATTWEVKPIDVVCDGAKSYTLPRDLEKVQESVATILLSDTSHGSGVIVSSDGHMLTAAHVVSGLNEVEVQLRSGLTLTAHVERVDKLQDVALLQLPGKGYKCLAVRTDQPPPISAEVYAIGTPWDKKLALSVSKGVVSGHRQWKGARYIQTDASINPGNSGGPLVDNKGRVVGIVVKKVKELGYEGLAFGVPTAVVAKRLGMRR